MNWIDADVALPENNDEYLTFNKGNGSMSVQFYNGYVWGYLVSVKPTVTHWMPLPEPPRKTNK